MAKFLIAVMDKREGATSIPRSYSFNDRDIPLPQLGWVLIHSDGQKWEVERIELNLPTAIPTIFCKVVSQ